MAKYVAYVRVSTGKQASSGLGLEAQQAAIKAFLKSSDHLLHTYVEVESGKSSDRPELAKALNHTKLAGAKLLVAKLDRLSRAVSFIAQLMDSRIDFVACDQPSATPLTIHIYAAMAEHERNMISERTKAALKAAKDRGVKLGGFRGVKINPALGTAAKQGRARSFNARVRAAIAELQAEGAISLSELARRLNERGIPTSRGGAWRPTQVARVLASEGGPQTV
jgi:DNA invertase Pin-like site-specific DNA recombinase